MTAHAHDHRPATRAETAADIAPQRPLLDLLGPGGLASAAQADELRAVQMKGDGDGEAIHEAAAHGISGPGGPLPHGERIQAAFGRHDVSDVQAHVGGAAAEAAMLMNAQAYATGRSVAFAETPDLHTAAHEAAHVVQQRGGVSLKGGVGQAGDTHERHADAVADAVVAGRSAEGLLDRYAGAGGAPAVQRQEAPAPNAAPATADGASLDDLLQALEGAATPADRRAAALALSTWSREHLVDGDALSAYLARPDVDDVEKTRILGELKVAIARNEFILGWSHRGGIDAGGADGWETTAHDGKTGKNRGPYPSHYLSQVNASDGQEWCTSFAGNAHAELGFSPGPRDPEAFKTESRWQQTERSMFRSGTRLLAWSRRGVDNEGKSLTAEEDAIAEGKVGSLLIDAAVWRGLVRRLRAADEAERGAVVDTMLTEHGTPQPGDVLVLGEGNNFRGRGKSHTALIESYDAGERTLYTVEGNTSHAVLGRRFDLTDPDVASKIIFVTRVGAGFFQRDAAPTPDTGQPAAAGPAPTQPTGAPAPQQPQAPKGPGGPELVAAARAINDRIAAVARGKAWLKGASDDASAYTLAGGKDVDDASVH